MALRAAYTLYHNVDMVWPQRYRPLGHRLVRGYSGHVDGKQGGSVASFADLVWERHQAADRPDADDAPTLMLGCVVQIRFADGLSFWLTPAEVEGRKPNRKVVEWESVREIGVVVEGRPRTVIVAAGQELLARGRRTLEGGTS